MCWLSLVIIISERVGGNKSYCYVTSPPPDMYVAELRHSVADGHVTLEVLKEFSATALVDGKSGLGGVMGSCCMDKAIKKARSAGVGWVCARGTLRDRKDQA